MIPDRAVIRSGSNVELKQERHTMIQAAKAPAAQDCPFQGQTGYFAGVEAETYYLEMKQLSQSWLKYFNPNPVSEKTPANFYYEYLAPDAERKFTDPLRFGQAFHLAILEPEEFNKRVHWWKDHKTTTSKGFQEADAAMGEREILCPLVWKDQLIDMLDALLANPETRALLEIEADNEVTMVWTDKETGVECKGRLDRAARKQGLLIDFKSTKDASEQGFVKSVQDFSYHVQDAFYSAGYKEVFGEDPRGFAFPLVEKKAPFLTNLVQLSPEAKEAGRYIFRRNIQRYADCIDKGHFPGYPQGTKTLDLEPWYSKRLEDDLV